MANSQSLHAAVASNGACRRRPVILSMVAPSKNEKKRPIKLVREIKITRNPKTRRLA